MMMLPLLSHEFELLRGRLVGWHHVIVNGTYKTNS